MEVFRPSSSHGSVKNGECFFVALQPNGVKSDYVARNFYRFSNATAQNKHSQIRTVVIVNHPLKIQNIVLRASTASLTGRKVSELGKEYKYYCDVDTCVIPKAVSLDEFLQDYEKVASVWQHKSKAGNDKQKDEFERTEPFDKDNLSDLAFRNGEIRKNLIMVFDRESKSIGGQLAHISDGMRIIYIAHYLRSCADMGFKGTRYCEYYDNDKWHYNDQLQLFGLLQAVANKEGEGGKFKKGANHLISLWNLLLAKEKCGPTHVMKRIEEIWSYFYSKPGCVDFDIWCLKAFHFLMSYSSVRGDSEIYNILIGCRHNFPVDPCLVKNTTHDRDKVSCAPVREKEHEISMVFSVNGDFVATYLSNLNGLAAVEEMEISAASAILVKHSEYALRVLRCRKTSFLLGANFVDEKEVPCEPMVMYKMVATHERNCDIKRTGKLCELCSLIDSRTCYGFPFSVYDVRKLAVASFISGEGDFYKPTFVGPANDRLSISNLSSSNNFVDTTMTAMLKSVKKYKACSELVEKRRTHLIDVKYLEWDSLMSDRSWRGTRYKLPILADDKDELNRIEVALKEGVLSRFFKVKDLPKKTVDSSHDHSSSEADKLHEEADSSVANTTQEQIERVAMKVKAFWEQLPKRRALTYEDSFS